MRFAKVVESVPTLHALKRIASAHVVDYAHLSAEQLSANILRVMNQYTHPEEAQAALDRALYLDPELSHRVLADIIIRDVLLNEYGHLLPVEELEEAVVECEQGVLNESNELTLKDMAGRTDTEHYNALSLYRFVLEVAWEHRDTKSVDEANLLRRLREKLSLTRREHRLLEAQLGKYPKDHNELHTRADINDEVKELERLGLVFEVRDDADQDFVVIPQEIVSVIKNVLGVEIRRPGYKELLQYKAVRSKAYLREMLDKSGVPVSPYATLSQLQQRAMETTPPSVVLGGHSPKDGLNNEDLYEWCSDLGLPVRGKKAERIDRLIEHYNQLQVRIREEKDDREVWYHFYQALASRDLDTLRQQHIIDKDGDVEKYFEQATNYLFENKLNHTPLRQAGTEHSDGLLSFRDRYVMWDNKSSQTPEHLKEHIRQFDSYMDRADKGVPIFLVIAPDFTPESEALALQYTADNLGRSIALVPADELKELAELWANDDNKRRSDPFPLGLFARPGTFRLDVVKASL